MCCCTLAAGTEVEPANLQPSPCERVISHSGKKQMQGPSQASAPGCSQDVFNGWMTSCRADVHPWQRLSHTAVVWICFFSSGQKGCTFPPHCVMEEGLNMAAVIFSNRHEQTPLVGNWVLYWQFSNALNIIPWMTNTESQEQGSCYHHWMGQASLMKGFWRSAKADFWRKLKGDKKAASAALHTPQQAASTNFHTV